MRIRCVLLLLALLLCLMLSGCQTVRLSPEQLMRPPVLTEEQTKIYTAAEKVIGEDVVFKYPNVMGVHSAFVLHDCDGDGMNEAMVFYQKDPESEIRINVLDQEGGDWRSICDVVGAGVNVDYVTFAALDSPDQVDVVIEWSNVSGSERILTVQTLLDNRFVTLFSNSFSNKTLLDIDRDGIEELIVLTGNNGSQQSAALLVEGMQDGTLAVTSSCPMCPETYEYVQLSKSITEDGKLAVLVDGRLVQGAMVSELVAYLDGQLVNLIYSDDFVHDLTYETYRAYEVLSSDIDYDGTVEIPALSELPGPYYVSVAFEPIYLTNWMKLENGGLTTTLSAVVNDTYGFYFVYPERWKDQVTVVAERPNEWLFSEYSFDEDGLFRLERSVLHLLIFSQSDFYDEFDTVGYEKLYENEQYVFFVCLEYTGDGLQLSQDELAALFVPISS